MAQLLPQPGQVIRYAYLWWSEARVGREDGAKDRPCGVISLVNASFFSSLSQDFFQPRMYSKTCFSETSVRA
jgi:hypothetical protein